MGKVIIDGNSLTINDVVNVARKGYIVELSEDAILRVKKARELVDKFVENEKVVYGITTGFGKFSEMVISKEETRQLQKNLIMSHSCGVGKPLSEEVVRAVMLLRANALAKGNSGIRLSTLQTLIDMLNKGVHPIIPEKGSLGASGDLAPLSHMVLVLLGEGEAIYRGERLSGRDAMNKAGIQTVELTSKEGLALINGTQIMTAIGALAVYDAKQLMKIADISAALTIEALNGIIDAFDERVHKVRPHLGQIRTASNIRRLCENSQNITRQGEIRVQDAYTLRCIPQIHGASKDAIKYVEEKISIEINSATDNPLIFSDDEFVVSGGNFHGQPIALAMDFLGIALSEIANSSERRIERLVNPQLSGLPAFLAEKGGLNSGFMIAQYTAASLVSENKVLAHPASVDSIPSSANQEDHVSMGTIAARKARDILFNVQNVLAIEMIAASQAIDFNGSEKLGKGTRAAYNKIRENIAHVDKDRILYKDINKSFELISSGDILREVESYIGELE
ncbi:histidine ammonia-lyase [Caloranaerobacter azorensis DSM 13643]|uniref:Histidine ammonia-lyase n=1 Tax=Caloranaerobacter azorensis DSM 13643 TaxID=1121264 RepID=A0A1M5SNY5_9FIRM|nr:histidine ammonia-lyase [Caloranaerobacter azorensis]SHH40224.1 histidine ammonia-lyase [Caloranaerobacter azorensis DSM 13643]